MKRKELESLVQYKDLGHPCPGSATKIIAVLYIMKSEIVPAGQSITEAEVRLRDSLLDDVLSGQTEETE